jgi:hypothetical protein
MRVLWRFTAWQVRTSETLLRWVACRMPRQLRYVTAMQALADATTDDELARREVPGLPLGDLLRVMERHSHGEVYPYVP